MRCLQHNQQVAREAPPSSTPGGKLFKRLQRMDAAGEAEAFGHLRLQGKMKCEESLAHFVKCCWPIICPGRKLQWNWSIDLICSFLEAFARRDFIRGIINIPPRGMKSILVSVVYPVWVWIQDPKNNPHAGPGHQFLCLSNSEELVLRDAEQARIIIESEWFQARWGTGIGELLPGDPGENEPISITDSQNEKKYYKNTANGHRNSRPIGSRITGRGGDTVLGDDLHDAEGATREKERKNVLDAWDGKVRTRLNDPATGGMLLIMQRVDGGDIVGYVLEKDGYYNKKRNPRGWVKLSLPLEWEADEQDQPPVNPAKRLGFVDPRTKPGELFWPSRYPLEVVEDLKKGLGHRAAGQLQQRPAPKGGEILKTNWWRVWGRSSWTKGKSLPVIKHAFASWDTAFTERDRESNAFSACTVWGVFWEENLQMDALILLHVWYGMVGYDRLREKAMAMGMPTPTIAGRPPKPPMLVKETGDSHLIERKASGLSLIQSLNRVKHIRVRGYDPGKDGDKVARAYLCQPMLKAGLVYVQDTKAHKKYVNIVGEFPSGAPPCRDLTDTTTQAIIHLHRGLWLHHPDDDNWANERDLVVDEVDLDDWPEDEAELNEGGIYG